MHEDSAINCKFLLTYCASANGSKATEIYIRTYTKLKSLFVMRNVCFPHSIKLCKNSRNSGLG